MPTPMDAMLGLVVTAIGLLTFVVAFGLAESSKRLISYVLAGIVSLSGVYYFSSSQLRGFQMRRRIAEIQRQQQVNIDEIQRRLRENPTQQPGRPTPPPPAR